MAEGEGEVAQSCPTLCNPVECSLPGSSVHGILQARILEWVAKVAQTVKRLSTMRETRVWSLGWEDPLEKEMAIHSSTLAWQIPWTEEPGRLQSMGLQRVGHDWATWLHLKNFITVSVYMCVCLSICDFMCIHRLDHSEIYSLVAQLVNNPPAVWETWVRTLRWDDPLEKGTATHSSMLAWRIPCTV